MPYIFNTPQDQAEMLEAIGAESIDQLFNCIPEDMQLGRPLEIPAALGELELTQQLSSMASMNMSTTNGTCFLGAGSYDHFVPAAVDTIASRGEFYTSYTPYQPEVSQGNLQAMFEYQSLICQLTGMDVSNASLYDGGTAAAEGVLMAMSVTKRNAKVVALDSVHPDYRQILSTYFDSIGTELVTVGSTNGLADLQSIVDELDEETAAILIQHPNFFGSLEDVQSIADAAHQVGALVVCCFDPISLGLLKRPGDLGVDIAVAEGHTLGTPMLYGGPYLGIMTCREEFVRRLPGRIAGQTVDRSGRRCWVLTLQTREQHIRREKATSNICTNQGLFALRAAIYLSLMGPAGMKQVATLCQQKAAYAAAQMDTLDRFELAIEKPFFKEFVVRDKQNDVPSLLKYCRDKNVLAGVPLGQWYSEWDDCFLISVTEKRTKEEIDQLVSLLGSHGGGQS
ncbi:MAG: aminomethyl-transferring glycine dehydrogenase [Rhodopirellula sp.]|nr:aminomethyl-transferring glycine dehydrogenase [Rhodopirellula sp.]